MAATLGAHNFSTYHAMGSVALGYNCSLNGLVEAWPTAVAFKLCVRGKQLTATVSAGVVAGVKGIHERAAKRCFGGLVEENGFLFGT